ncbi:transcriptional regulator [Candidatus Arthromitus sp. SFB-turkey]|uniref:transcriptional regulator n=1 Tax=Candidatus Arthromitus sp. SFB-turkey TaxID=1840217 RepID=UPI001FA7A925|nr:transcriptional regulator [Candidatus Arthromitus sp. SFB-turkey]
MDIKLIQKGSISLRSVILIFIRRKNWETIGREYEAMGEINVELSECGFFSVFEELVKYEIRLSESDNLDDYDGSKKRGHILC